MGCSLAPFGKGCSLAPFGKGCQQYILREGMSTIYPVPGLCFPLLLSTLKKTATTIERNSSDWFGNLTAPLFVLVARDIMACCHRQPFFAEHGGGLGRGAGVFPSTKPHFLCFIFYYGGMTATTVSSNRALKSVALHPHSALCSRASCDATWRTTSLPTFEDWWIRTSLASCERCVCENHAPFGGGGLSRINIV